jgi:hypothetical protein
MNKGEYTLKQQMGSKGYFGMVRLVQSQHDSPGLTIVFDDKCSSEWRIGVEFGITHAWEIFARTQSGRRDMRVCVLETMGQTVDTSNLVMAFVSANALWNALGWVPPKPPAFDPKTGCFTFSKF